MSVAVNQRPSSAWWVVLLQGIATLILGILLLSSPFITSLTFIIFIGAYWLVDGIFSLIRIFTKDSDIHWGWLLFRGILGIIAGFMIMRSPLVGLLVVPTTIIIIVAIQGIVMGVIGLIESFKGAGWGAGILGVVNILIGILLLSRPLLAAAVLPWVLGIMAIVFGILTIIVSFKLRSA